MNGLKMYDEIHGKANGKNPPLVLLHGGVGAIEMLKAQSAFREFEQAQIEMDQWKQRERELSGAVVEFHRRISDMHHQHVSCRICREHVKRIQGIDKRD